MLIVKPSNRTRTDESSSPHSTPGSTADVGPRGWRLLGLILSAALVIRLVGIRHGMPFSYNTDEEHHFVPQAAEAADGDLDPDYYQNPAALTYLLAIVYRLRFLGDDMTERLATDPTSVFLASRVVVALLSTVLVALVYWAGTRFFDTRTGLIASAVIGSAFLPVFYSHQALNDVPTLLGITVALVGCLQIYERGGWRAYVLAGAGVGVAAGTKYLAAPFAVTVIVAVVLSVLARKERPGRGFLLLCAAGAATIAVIVVLNPFLVIEIDDAWRQYQSQAEAAGTPKLGQTGNGWSYYPWTLLWGFGVVPLALAVVGLVAALGRDRVRAIILIVFPVVLYLDMAGQGRFFGRWMLPIYPALAILAGYGAVRLASWLRTRAGTRRARLGAAALPAVVVLALAQPLADSIRSDLTLRQTDTRTQAHDWLRENLAEGERLAPEPSLPSTYWDDLGHLQLYPLQRPFQEFENRLGPEWIDTYRTQGYCWVLVNSHQRDRGLSEGLDGARAYYQRLAEDSRVAFVFSPYRRGSSTPDFSFDFSFDWYPLAYERPGPYIEIRRLDDC